MNVKVLIGYHATDFSNAEPILQNGFHESISENNQLEWLGNGVYFWEDDYYAVQWNVINIEKMLKIGTKKIPSDYVILKATIKADKLKVFDISSPEGSIVYNEMKKQLIDKYMEKGRQDIANRLINRSSKFWTNILENNGFFREFDIITAIYKNEKNEENYKDDIVLNTQKQICVKNKKCIKTTEIYSDNERISSLYSIIFDKRKKCYEKN